MSMELTIERDGGSGEGIGFHEGMTVFVPFSLAGERVCVSIIKQNKRYAQARLERVIDAAPERAEPYCPFYGSCGGCAMQHMTYDKALSIKQSRVAQTLRRIGGIETEGILLPPLGMDEPYAYRNKAVFPIRGKRIGFYRENSREIESIANCALLPDVMNRALRITAEWLTQTRDIANIRSLLVRTNRAGNCMAALSTVGKNLADAQGWARRMRDGIPECVSLLHGTDTPEKGEAIGRSFCVLYGEETLPESAMGIEYRVSAASFQQVNPAQAEALYREAVRFAGLSPNETVLDAYCGAGLLTQLLAREAGAACGVEWSAAAIEDARESALRNGCENISFLHGACEDVLPNLLANDMRPDCVVLDPPRKGCDPRVIDAVLRAAPARIVYISCDPATLARDAAALCEGDVYSARAVRVVDMFPWTAHVETVVLLGRT